MDDTIEKTIRNKISSLEGDLKILYEKRDNLLSEIDKNENLLSNYRAVYQNETGRPYSSTIIEYRKKMTIARAAELVLREVGEPMKASEIIEVIRKRNLAAINERYGVSTLITVMRRKRELFESTGHGYYSLRIK